MTTRRSARSSSKLPPPSASTTPGFGGLLEHVLCLVRVCAATAPFYPEVDPDLLVTGAILHDIGKVCELSWGSTFDYTLEGQLIGHISIAQGMLHEKIAQLNAPMFVIPQRSGGICIPSSGCPVHRAARGGASSRREWG